METKVIGQLLWLCTCAVLGQSVDLGGSSSSSSELVAIHALTAGMQVLRTVSAAQIANTLGLPATRWNELLVPPTTKKDGDAYTTPLRLALNTMYTLHDHAELFSDLQQTLVDDVEVNAVLVVLRQNVKDSCHWASSLVQKGPSLECSCSEENIRSMCIHWEALALTEEAEQDLQVYMKEVEVTPLEWLTKHINCKLPVPQVVRNKILQYISQS